MSLERLGTLVARHLEAHGPKLDAKRGLRRLRAAKRQGSPQRWLFAALVPLVLVAVWLSWPRTAPQGPAPLSYVVERAGLRFSDGTRIDMGDDARAQVMRIDEHGADVALERGAVTAAVSHREGARWQVAAGPFTVRVTGTEFTVSWDAEDEVFALSMHDGSVVVSGPVIGQARELRAPDEIVVHAREGRVRLGPADPDPAPEVSARTPEPERATQSAPAPKKDWRARLADGERGEAMAMLKEAGALDREDAAGLMLIAQTARLTGDAALAARALQRLEQRFPDSVEAATAAFLRGKLHFDAGRHGDAISLFQQYLRAAPGGTFAREARVLLILSLHATGRRDEARTLAEGYLAQHPDDAHAARLRQLVEP